jgi:hypothetical protein
MDNGEVPDALIAEHGISVLAIVSKGDRMVCGYPDQRRE